MPRNPSVYKLVPIDGINTFLFQFFHKMNTIVVALLLAISVTVCVTAPLNGNICGGISPSSRWLRTGRGDAIIMNIDTSSCSFQDVPLYFTNITSGVGHYLLTGINVIYEPTTYGFSINVRSINGATADTLMGRSAQWKVQ